MRFANVDWNIYTSDTSVVFPSFLYFLTKCESYVTEFMVSFYEGNENNENLVGP